MSEKPVIFISHSSKDGDIANTVKTEVENLFNNELEVWHSSRDDSISAGEDWLESISNQLDKADALLVLVSRYSNTSEWVHWEIGYFEKRRRDTEIKLPVYVTIIANEPLFDLLAYKRAQSKSFNNLESIGNLLRDIASHFNHKVDDGIVACAERIIAHVRNQPYSDEDVQILRDYLNLDYKEKAPIVYRTLDAQKGFPRGFTQEMLPRLAQETNWTLIEKQTNETSARLRKTGGGGARVIQP